MILQNLIIYAGTGIETQGESSRVSDFISDLSGNTPINGKHLPDRFTLKNKKIARDYIVERMKELGLKPLRQEYNSSGENIYAILEATTSSNEYIIIGAHYDTVRECPGANDNASGAAFVYGTAINMMQLENRLKNIIFVFFDDEEKGLRGSRSFAQKVKDDNLNIHSVHTIDQFAWDSDNDRAIELELPYDGIMDVYRDVLKENNWEVPLHYSDVPATDHTSFRRLDYRAVGITEEYQNGDTTPYYHRPSDTFETVDMEYLEFGIKVFVKVLIRIMEK